MRARFWKRSETWGLGLAILTLIVITVFTLHAWTALQNARDEVTQTRNLYEEVGDLLQTALDAETGQLGFLLTGKPEYLEPYNRAVGMLPARLADLRRLSIDDP